MFGIKLKKIGRFSLAVGLAICVTLLGLNIVVEKHFDDLPKLSIVVGNPVDAYTGTVDYDGVTSDAVKQALNALPATGGEVVLVSPAYTFTETLSRAINNVTVRGLNGTTITYAGACFNVGAQTGWRFLDLKIAVGGSITNGTNACYENVTVGATYYTYRAPNTVGNISAPSVADSSLSSNRIVLSGAGGVLGSLGAGTSGQVLYSAGAGVDPSWGDNAGSANGVYVDTTYGTAGGSGSARDPIDTLANGITAAAANKLTQIYLGPGSYTMPVGTVTKLHIVGQAAGGIYPSTNIDLNGCTISTEVVIERCGILGSWTTSGATSLRTVECSFNQDLVTDMGDKIAAYNCLIDKICLSTSGWLYNCHGESSILNTNNTYGSFYFVNHSGYLQLTNFTHIGKPGVYIWSSNAFINIAASTTYINLYVYGSTTIYNGSTSANVSVIDHNYTIRRKSKTIDLNQAAGTYDLFTGAFAGENIIKSLSFKVSSGAVGGALTSISIQTNDATPYTFISAAEGAVVNLTSEANISWSSGGAISVLNASKKIQLTIGGGAHGVSKICTVFIEYEGVNGGYLN